MKRAKPARRGKQEIASKAKIKNINDTLQSVMKQAKPAQREKQVATYLTIALRDDGKQVSYAP